MSYKWEDYATRCYQQNDDDERRDDSSKASAWNNVKKDPEGLEMLATMIF